MSMSLISPSIILLPLQPGSPEAVTLIPQLPLTWKHRTPCHCLWDPSMLISEGERGEKGWGEEGQGAEWGSDRAIVAGILQGLPEHPTLKPCSFIICLRERERERTLPCRLLGIWQAAYVLFKVSHTSKPNKKMSVHTHSSAALHTESLRCVTRFQKRFDHSEACPAFEHF